MCTDQQPHYVKQLQKYKKEKDLQYKGKQISERKVLKNKNLKVNINRSNELTV